MCSRFCALLSSILPARLSNFKTWKYWPSISLLRNPARSVDKTAVKLEVFIIMNYPEADDITAIKINKKSYPSSFRRVFGTSYFLPHGIFIFFSVYSMSFYAIDKALLKKSPNRLGVESMARFQILNSSFFENPLDSYYLSPTWRRINTWRIWVITVLNNESFRC